MTVFADLPDEVLLHLMLYHTSDATLLTLTKVSKRLHKLGNEIKTNPYLSSLREQYRRTRVNFKYGYYHVLKDTNIKDGPYHYEDELITGEGQFVNDKHEGVWEAYFLNSTRLNFKAQYIKGHLVNHLELYHDDGRLDFRGNPEGVRCMFLSRMNTPFCEFTSNDEQEDMFRLKLKPLSSQQSSRCTLQ